MLMTDHTVLPGTYTFMDKWNEICAFTPQPQSITALWPVLISHPTKGRRPSWPSSLTPASLCTNAKRKTESQIRREGVDLYKMHPNKSYLNITINQTLTNNNNSVLVALSVCQHNQRSRWQNMAYLLPTLVIQAEQSIMCVCVCVNWQKVLNTTTIEPDTLHAGSSRHYL